MLRELARKIDAFQDRFGRSVSWIMLLMVLVVFSDVVMRYAFNKSSVFAQELEWHLFGLVYLLGAGYTMLYDEHVRVDILYSHVLRSEEHTSELQSRQYLVCRLLLEKKKKKTKTAEITKMS